MIAKETVRELAESIAAAKRTRDYVLTYERTTSPKKVRDAYVAWLERVISEGLNR